jgi:hypothetical protein
MSEPNDLREALQSLQRTMATDPRDWAMDKRDAWCFGIVLGWDHEDPDDDLTEDAMPELIARFGWSDEDVARLRRYRAAFKQAAEGA